MISPTKQFLNQQGWVYIWGHLLKKTEGLNYDIVQIFERLALTHAADQQGRLPGDERDVVQAVLMDDEYLAVPILTGEAIDNDGNFPIDDE